MEAYLMTAQVSISPSHIESELSRIWDSLEGTNKMRACLFNLIFYTKKNERASYLQTIAQKVIDKFPSRVIFINADPTSSENDLKAKVSVLSSASGACDVACDRIEIDALGSQQERIPFVILPHLIPDLPVYLVWGEDPSQENPIAIELEKLATRLIFDSETTDHLPNFATSILRHRERSFCDIADLNWARMGNWREMLSKTFYSKEKLELLERAKTLRICFNSQETAFFCHTNIQATYLQAWICCQLNWELEDLSSEPGTLSFHYRQGKQPILVELISQKVAGLSSGSIMSLELLTSEQEHLIFSRDILFPHQILFNYSTLQRCELPSKYVFAKSDMG
ncbi:MAG: glucose-6-phosphate dehydrogenase assembly protein OpcA, partial [Anaerolineae bacterium]